MITIQELVQREIIYCVSSLVYTLTQENKLDEDLALELWSGPYDYDAAEYELNQQGCFVCDERGSRVYQALAHQSQQDDDDGLYGIYHDENDEFIVDTYYDSKEEAVYEYFDGDLEEYRQEVFEHWLVSSWLSKKLQEHGETVIEDFYGLTIWARCTTGQAIWMDWVIQQIYNAFYE